PRPARERGGLGDGEAEIGRRRVAERAGGGGLRRFHAGPAHGEGALARRALDAHPRRHLRRHGKAQPLSAAGTADVEERRRDRGGLGHAASFSAILLDRYPRPPLTPLRPLSPTAHPAPGREGVGKAASSFAVSLLSPGGWV